LEFDTQKQANNERKAIFPIKVQIFLARIVRDERKNAKFRIFPRQNHYSLAIFLFEFDTQKQANSERKAIFAIKVLTFLAQIVRDERKNAKIRISSEKSLFARYFPF